MGNGETWEGTRNARVGRHGARCRESGTLRRIELIGTPRIERRIAALRRLDAEGRSAAPVAFWSLLQAFDAGAGP